MNFKESYVLVKAKDFLPWLKQLVVHSSQSTSLVCVCPGAVFAVDKPSCVCVMSITETFSTYHVLLVLFSLASAKVQLSPPSNSRLLL